MISADTLVVIGSGIVIEGAHREIEHTVVCTLVGRQYHLVGLCLLKLLHACRGSREHAIIEITLIHSPHICQAQDDETDDHGHLLDTFPPIRQQHQSAHAHHNETSHGIGREHGSTHVRHIAKNIGRELLRYVSRLHILAHIALVGTGKIISKEQIRHQPEEQGHTSRQSKAEGKIMLAGEMPPLTLSLQTGRVFHKFLQSKHSQQGDGELGNDKYTGHGAELIIHGDIIQEEVCESHEILSPRQEDTQDGGCQQAPLHGATYYEEAQDEKHQHESTHIDGSARARLFSPILSKCLIDG